MIRNRVVRRGAGLPAGQVVRTVLPVVVLLLGCCSAWRPDADESQSRGIDALRKGEYEKAREHFETALKTKPEHADARRGLLQVLRETGRYEEAGRAAKGFLSSSEGSPEIHLEAARSLRAVGATAEAEKHLRRSLALGGPSRLDATRELGLLLEDAGKKADAGALWNGIVEEYRRGAVRGSHALGHVAVAAWRLGWAQDAKDIFLDATAGEGVSLEALTSFGYLFLEKYNAQDATGVFRDCLKINPRFPDALVGLALAKKYESNDEAEKFARAALEVNPRLVAARNLLAELRIQEDNLPEAIRNIEAALEINPSDLESLSLAAVYRRLLKDDGKFSEIEQKVLALHPFYGSLYHTLAENYVIRRKYAEAVEYNRKAVSLDPSLWAAHASLGMNLMRIGELAEGRRSIEKAFEGDPYHIWAFNTLDLLDQMDGFEQVRTDHTILKMAKEDFQVLSPLSSRLAEEAYETLTRKYRFVPEDPIQVELFPDHGGFAVRTLGLPGLGALGVCFGKVIAMDSPRARRRGDFNWGSTLWHEFAHVITLQMTRHNIPRWFAEGISVYEERRARPGWGDDLNAQILRAYSDGKLLKVSQLNQGMMRPRFPEQVGLSYYQASLVCELIEERFGFEKIRESLLLFADDYSAEEVFKRALGWDGATLDDEFSKYLDARLKPTSRRLDFKQFEETAPGTKPDKAAVAERLGKNPDDFFGNLRMGALLRSEKANREAETFLKKSISLFPEYVEPGSGYHLLSDLYQEEKRAEDALEVNLAWSRYDENSVPPLIRAGEIYLDRKDWAKAVRMLSLSLFVHPYDPDVYAKLGRAAMEARDWPAAVASFQGVLALNPTDAAGAHYDLARAWFESGRRQEARRETLRALEIAPTFERAQELLLKLSRSGP